MFDSLLRVLTLVIILAPLAAAQDRAFMHAVDQLADPSAVQRSNAIDRIANWHGDIGPELRVAYRTGSAHERLGLLHAAQVRADAALAGLAADALADADERVSAAASDYLLALPASAMHARDGETWQAFLRLRTQREMYFSLISQHLEPGGYTGQFWAILGRERCRDMQAELLALIQASTDSGRALSIAAAERVAHDVDARQAFRSAWQHLREGLPATRAAGTYFASRDPEALDSRVATPAMQSALGLLTDLRVLAVRALGDCELDAETLDALWELHRELGLEDPEPEYRVALDARRVRMEVEVTLARHGQGTLLDARLADLRVQSIRSREVMGPQMNINAGMRSDLVSMNEIGLLLMRSGRLAEAEEHWQRAVEYVRSDLPLVHSRFRRTLVTFMGVAYYNLACAQARQLKVTAGFESLQRAAEHGYDDFAWILADGDLHHLRGSDVFDGWFRRVAPPAVLHALDRP
jgi:tetratricopeptide (TPR) repeat protein